MTPPEDPALVRRALLLASSLVLEKVAARDTSDETCRLARAFHSVPSLIGRNADPNQVWEQLHHAANRSGNNTAVEALLTRALTRVSASDHG